MFLQRAARDIGRVAFRFCRNKQQIPDSPLSFFVGELYDSANKNNSDLRNILDGMYFQPKLLHPCCNDIK